MIKFTTNKKNNKVFLKQKKKRKMLMWILQDNLYTGSSYCCINSCKSVVIIQSLSYVWLFATPWTVAGQAPLSSPISLSLLQFTTIDLVMLCNHLILCCSPLLLPSIFPSIRGFPRSQFFASGSQSTGASTSATVLPRIIQGWFSLWLTGLISLQSKELPRVFSRTTIQEKISDILLRERKKTGLWWMCVTLLALCFGKCKIKMI